MTEQGRYATMVFEDLLWRLFPIMLREAIKVAREYPEATDAELERRLSEHCRAMQTEYDRQIGELARAELKEKRDRKSDPETVKRNLEICVLRKKDKRKWSIAKLARQYQLTPRAITKILSAEAKWHWLAQTGTK
jgi:hypothetical protein